MRTRLAPTPSGYLHPGNGASFVLTWALARAHGADILLRIDDMDTQRRRPEYVEDIFRTIDWLGIDYDLGPNGPDDFLAHWSQTHRLDLYHAALSTLREGAPLYACDCSRSKRREMAVDHRYTGHCRKLQKNLDADRMAWRIHLPDPTEVHIRSWHQPQQSLNLARIMGDFVVRSRSGQVAYQLTSVIDDLHFGVDRIVRGADLLPSTAAQRYLATAIGEPRFGDILFWHHALLVGEDGEKLSKSAGAGSLWQWREAGRTPEAVYRQVAQWLGHNEAKPDTPKELVQLAKLYTKK